MSGIGITPTEQQVKLPSGNEWKIITVCEAKRKVKIELCFREVNEIDKGGFGVVKTIITSNGTKYALKQLNYEAKYKNREVSIMSTLDHTNCTRLFFYYFERDHKTSDIRVSLIMELMPTSLSKILARLHQTETELSCLHIRLYLYQLLRGVAYLHLEGIAHRDIKPHNILIDESTARLKVCDFGSAKKLKESERNIAYICSRFYRAPELILGNCKYGFAIDSWAVGCVFAELFLQRPIFLGESSLDQFTEIVRILGTPTPEQMEKLHPLFPKDLIKHDPMNLKKHLKRACNQAVCLLLKLLHYPPDRRIQCWEALAETYFDNLRQPGVKLPTGKPLPPLFNFTTSELSQNPVMNQLLMPYE